MTPLVTDRLSLDPCTPEDAPFILRLLNEPSFLEYIGDKGVRSLEDAEEHVRSGPMASYARHGHGLQKVSLRATGELLGMAGLLKRDHLPDADLGFAFLPEATGHGYAFEAGVAVLAHARRELGHSRTLAIVYPANTRSIRLLERLGFTYARTIPAQFGEAETAVYECHQGA